MNRSLSLVSWLGLDFRLLSKCIPFAFTSNHYVSFVVLSLYLQWTNLNKKWISFNLTWNFLVVFLKILICCLTSCSQCLRNSPKFIFLRFFSLSIFNYIGSSQKINTFNIFKTFCKLHPHIFGLLYLRIKYPRISEIEIYVEHLHKYWRQE